MLAIFGLLISGLTVCRGLEPETILIFNSPQYPVEETSGAATIGVTRLGNTNNAVKVDFSIRQASATAEADFTPVIGTLSFKPGETNKTVNIPILDDPIAEGTESADLVLSNPTGGAVLDARATSKLIILDNERRGSLWDRTFSVPTRATEFVTAIIPQSEDRILVSGGFGSSGTNVTERIIRLDSEGSVDSEFEVLEGIPNDKILAVAVQRDGKVVIGGAFTRIGSVTRNRIARLNPDGSLDRTFDPGSGVDGSVAPAVFAIALQRDGKIVVGGNFDKVRGASRNVLARLNTNGSLDTTFDSGPGVTSSDMNFQVPWVSAVAVQPNGKLVIGGQFTDVAGQSRVNIARLNADGTVDLSFDPGTGASGKLASVAALALQSDGKIVLGGEFSYVNDVVRLGVARLEINGSLDLGFNPGTGVTRTDDAGDIIAGAVTSLAVQGDGRILVGGEFSAVDDRSRPGLARLNANGSLDNSFGPGYGTTLRNELGYEDLELVSALSPQPDGQVLVGGRFVSANGARSIRIVRLLNSNIRSPSFEFSKAGASVGEASKEISLTVIRRGDSTNIATVGFVTLGGTATPGVDYTFRSGTLRFGPLEVEKTISIPILDDGNAEDDETFNIVLRNPSTGSTLGAPVIFTARIIDRLKPSNLDLSFAQVTIPFRNHASAYRPVMAIALQSDEKILVAGHFTSVNGTNRAGLVRLETDGGIDPSFVPEVPAGASTLDFHQMGLQPDGRLVGGFEGVNRVNKDGTLDTQFAPDVGSVNALAVQSDGKVLVADEFFDLFAGVNRNQISRFLTNGWLDTLFSPPAEADDWVNAILPQPDGKVLIGGYFTHINGESRYRIARLNQDGSLDVSFDVGTGISGPRATVYALVLQPDGKIIVGGDFTRVNNVTRNHLVRLNPDGSIDATFASGTGPNHYVEAIAIQPDGRLLVGGSFTTYDGVRRIGLARLESDGTLDRDFEPDLTFPDAVAVNVITLQADAKILIGGLFTAVNGAPRTGLARLNGDAGILKLDTAPRAPKSPFRITLTCRPGMQYRIEASTDLVNWVLITTAVAEGYTMEIEDPNATGPFGRFYRAVQVEP